MKPIAMLVLAALLLGAVAHARAPEYDEAYSIFLTAGDARPAWPAGVFRAGDVRARFSGQASPWQIARDLRQGDVHPPLYFWALEYWRRLVGPSWFAARLLSVGFAVAALALVAWIAEASAIPPGAAIMVTLLSYGFAYTGIVARGFALAQLLNLAGVALILAAVKTHDRRLAFAGGVVLSAASFANYLAIFIGGAVMLWLARFYRRLLLPASVGLLILLPVDFYFFIGQKAAHAKQFAAFSLRHAAALLVKDFGAAMFGGLPVYAGHFGKPVALALGLLFMLCAGMAMLRLNRRTCLFALAALAPSCGLLALGLVFDNTPIEIRYLAFSMPFVGLFFAALPRPLLLVLASVESAGIIGLAFAPATMQPQGRAAVAATDDATPNTLVLLPFGNDGVGVPGPFIEAAPDDMRIELVRGAVPDLAAENRVILAAVTPDAASRAAVQSLALSLPANAWHPDPPLPLLLTFTRNCNPN